MVKKLSCVSCGSLKRFPQTFTIMAPMSIEKNKILGAGLELAAKLHCQFSPFGPFLR